MEGLLCYCASTNKICLATQHENLLHATHNHPLIRFKEGLITIRLRYPQVVQLALLVISNELPMPVFGKFERLFCIFSVQRNESNDN